MHRSGTSAFAGLLKHAGIPMGKLKEASFDNPKGFYENKRVVQFNDKILGLLGQSWDSTIALPENWTSIGTISILKKEIKAFLEKEFKGVDLFALKDPRFSLTLALWKDVFDELGINIKHYIIIRNPYEIAASLKQRSYLSKDRSIALWMKYLLSAESASRGQDRQFIDYESILKEPVTVLQSLKINFKKPLSKIEGIANSFINPHLRHHQSHQIESASLLQQIDKAISVLIKKTQDKDACAILDAIKNSEDYKAIIKEEMVVASMTLDLGNGFTEVEPIIKPVQIDTTQLIFQLEYEEAKIPKRIQFYPANTLSSIQITKLRLLTKDNEEIAVTRIVKTPLLEHGNTFIFDKEGFVELELMPTPSSLAYFVVDLKYLNFRQQVHSDIKTLSMQVQDWYEQRESTLVNFQDVRKKEVQEKDMEKTWFWLEFLKTAFKYPQRFFKHINSDNYRKLRRALANESPALILKNLKRYLRNGGNKDLVAFETELVSHKQKDSLLSDASLAIQAPTSNLGKILYVFQDLPDYDRSSGGKRATRILELLAMDFEVYAFSLGKKPQKYIDELSKRGVQVLETASYRKVKRKFSGFTAIIYCTYRMYYESKQFVKLYPNAKIIIDTVDVNWLREERSIGIWEGLTLERVEKNKEREIAAYEEVDDVWAVTNEDKQVILEEIPTANISIVSNVHEPIFTTYRDSGTNNLLFIGNYTHYPNISAIKTLALDIFPKVREVIKDAQLIIAGSNAPKEVIQMAEQPGIIFRGFVEESSMDELYENTFLSVSPLLTGAGIKGKICESIVYMTPVVTNEIGNEGINLIHEKEGLITSIESMPAILIKALQRAYPFEEITRKAQQKIAGLVGKKVVRQEMVRSIFPEVSICIVTWNRLKLLKKCLASIESNTVYPNYKIIVYSNACTDGTQDYLKKIAKNNDRIVTIFSEQNEVFVRPNNKMMQLMPKNDVVLLNNDIQVTKNWLCALQKAAYSASDYGIVGAKILYPDGRLQEFGSELFSDGTGHNIGKGDDPSRKKYKRLKEVGYVSACTMYIKRSTIDTIGVFDEAFHPCYCEDSDYCYTAKEYGLKTVVTPDSIIYHEEGGTSGIDINQGFKKYQKINMQKFLNKHKSKLTDLENTKFYFFNYS